MTDTTTRQSTPTVTQRLPVNPRRHKVAPEQRKRVATACNSCNVRRIKCSGERPCRQCRSSNRDCHYPSPVEKVSIVKTELEELRRRCAAFETCLQDAVPDPTRRNDMLRRVDPRVVTADPSIYQPRLDDASDEARAATGGRILHDPDGNARYLGETSGATFLDYLKEFMNTVFPLAFNQNWDPSSSAGTAFLESVGKYQTYDSRPLYEPDVNVNPLWLPSRPDMSAMLSELRCFIQDGNGGFPSGGIYWWGDLNTVPMDPAVMASSLPDLDKHRHLAFYHAAFAVSCQASVVPTPNFQPDGLMGEAYFVRARLLLGSPLDISRYTISDVAVLALMGFYLIEMNRRDAAYMFISVAMHISIMHGVHRGWVDERGKRVFWTLYILDRWLSCLMGRPPTILDDAIRLPLPCDVPSMPPAAGLCAHIELSRISGHIVCNTYRIAPWKNTSDGAAKHVDEAMHMLGRWINSLPKTLQLSGDSMSDDPATCTLHMAYNQLLLLTVRPIFFVAVKKSFAERYVSRRWTIEHHSQLGHIRACSDAARRNLRLARRLLALSNRRLLQAPLHHVFNAAIILMLQELVCTNLGPTDIEDVLFTIGIFETESRTGSNYARDCARVLQDLRSLVTRLKVPDPPPQASLAPPSGPGPVAVAVTVPAPVVAAANAPVHAPATAPLVQAVPQHSQPVSAPLPTENGSTVHETVVAPAVSVHMDPRLIPGQTAHPFPIQMSESDALYQQLVSWMDYDDLQMYTNYLI